MFYIYIYTDVLARHARQTVLCASQSGSDFSNLSMNIRIRAIDQSLCRFWTVRHVFEKLGTARSSSSCHGSHDVVIGGQGMHHEPP